MAIACTLAASATPSTAADITISFAGVTTNSYVIAASNALATDAFSTVTDNAGNTWTQIADCPAAGSVGRRMDLWICAKPTSNFATITLAHAHTGQAQASLIEVTGANQVSFTDQVAALEHAASTTPAAVAITPSASGTLAIAVIQANSNNHSTAVTVPSGWTDLAGYNTAGPKIVFQVGPASGVALSPAFVLTASQGSGSNTANFFAAGAAGPPLPSIHPVLQAVKRASIF